MNDLTYDVIRLRNGAVISWADDISYPEDISHVITTGLSFYEALAAVAEIQKEDTKGGSSGTE